MRTLTYRQTGSVKTLERRYRAAILNHFHNPCEASLATAYELGRLAISKQTTLIELASLHHRALQHVLGSTDGSQLQKEVLNFAAVFLAESLSPFEMTHRGFQDAVKALRHLNQTLEEEIKRIAYAVHDEAGQLLVAVHLAVADIAVGLPKRQQRELARVKKLLRRVEDHLRRYSHELRPTVLDDLGWIPAARLLADGISQRSGFPVEIASNVKGRLPSTHETVLYRVVQEALGNAARHSRASRVRIHVRQQRGIICCSIQDDGIGFDLHSLRSGRKRKGLGLIAMRERLDAIGGTLSVVSIPGRGTRLTIRIPREEPHALSHRPR